MCEAVIERILLRLVQARRDGDDLRIFDIQLQLGRDFGVNYFFAQPEVLDVDLLEGRQGRVKRVEVGGAFDHDGLTTTDVESIVNVAHF